ncbi:Uncharacterised protein [Vibrio cholerae]|nr:Uncharacterised protein [Vibrio cholerae]CSI93011.1 Uncharacterised protein [Vibrio cholerae]
MTVTCVTRWHHTVKHVDTTTHTFHQVFRFTDAHQITWLVFR